MRRVGFIFFVAIAFATSTFSRIGLSVAAQQPNVILIITDDLGNTGLSSWGSSFYETPHIDALAKSGVLFKSFYSASCLCSPARASLMTGKYPQRVGITEYIESTRKTGPHSHETTLPQTEVTLGEAFKKNGYQTGYIGKWHLGAEAGGWPKDHGFDWAMASCERGAPPGLPGVQTAPLDTGLRRDSLNFSES